MDCGTAECTETTEYVLDEDTGVFGGASAGAEKFEHWNARKLAEYVEERGLKSYSSMIVTHKITGKVAQQLTDADLKEMGMTIVGDRLRFKQIILQLGRKANTAAKTKPLWKGEKQRYYSGCEKECCTCFGLMPDDPTTYKLYDSTLKVKQVDPVKCGPIGCCFYDYSIKNVALPKVKDVEYINIPAPCPQRTCCCAKGTDLVDIHPIDDTYSKLVLKLNPGEGEEACKVILNQVEQNQVMRRD